MSELIDRERFSADMRDFQNRVGIWRDEAEDTETRTRADAALATIIETKLILDKQPTIPAPRWNRVKDELPPPNKTVLVCKIWGDVNGEPHKVITMDSFTISPSDSVIAWMPLPEPPKEDA